MGSMLARATLSRGAGRSVPRAVLFLAAVACTPSNDLMPLRGEDPQALALSGDRADWVSKTGATRAFERFREALLNEEWEEGAGWLGPDTLAVLALRSRQSGVSIARLLEEGRVEGLSLSGSDDPLRDLRAPGAATVAEDRPFDPSRTAVTLVVRRGEGATPILVPAVHTEGGWRVELVRALPGRQDPAIAPSASESR